MNKIKISVYVIILSSLVGTLAFAAADPWSESYRLEVLTQYEAAAKALDPVLSKNSRNEFAILRQGWLNYLRGSLNQSIKDYKKAMDINSVSLDARLGVILPLLAQQRWREAASYSNQVLKVAPWNYYAHVRLMIAEEGLKQWDTLEKHAKTVYARYPSDPTILVYLARAHRWKDNTKSASEIYKLVLERVPGHIEATQYLAGVR